MFQKDQYLFLLSLFTLFIHTFSVYKSLINRFSNTKHTLTDVRYTHKYDNLTRFVNHCVTVLYLATANYHISLTRPCDSLEAPKGGSCFIITDSLM